MSIGGPLLAVYSFLQNEGFLSGVRTVADIGSIEYEIKAAEHERVFEEFFKRAGAPVPIGRNPETGFYKGEAREFYENLGYKYIALDIDGRFGSRVFDLNYDHVPEELIGWSDLTANLGTIEHVFNQLNCFRVVHDLTKPGGLMIHLSPVNDMMYHGLYQYNPGLFSSLAEFNDYAMLGQWASTKDPSFWLPTSEKKSVRASSVIITLMQKKSASEFAIPLQIDTPMVVHEEALGQYKLSAFARHAPARPTYDMGFKVDFATLESRRMSMEEILSNEQLKILAEGGPDSPNVKLRELKRELRKKDKLIQNMQKQSESRPRARWLATIMGRVLSRPL